jgi:isocitrate dehydrogenase
MGDKLALFEATHGTAPTIAGKDMANPLSMILSGAMLLEHIGWPEAAEIIHAAADSVLSSGRVTADLAPQMQGAKKVGCREFTDSLLGAL